MVEPKIYERTDIQRIVMRLILLNFVIWYI